MSGEGKTFFAINLAASLAAGGKRVVILDFDLRKPGILERLGMEAGKGLSNLLLSDGTSMAEVIRPVDQVNGLFVVGAGPIQPNPAELLLDLRKEELIDDFKELFDYVIIDTSPVGQVADALSFGSIVDSTIYLVRYNFTNKAQIKIIDDIFRKNKLNHPMIVMNDSKRHNGFSYTYGYGYADVKARPDKTYYQKA
jgi:capsular exopolysaccharide synthesis family protein